MYGTVVEMGVELMAQYGLFLLLVVFVLEGALVGKLIPTRALFVAAVVAVGTEGILGVAAVAVIGATLGQLVLFGLVRYTDATPESLPGSADPDTSRVSQWFDRWGLSAVAITNALPIARGSLTVPAAMSETTPVRFSASSLVGTAVYTAGLLAIASGLEVFISTL